MSLDEAKMTISEQASLVLRSNDEDLTSAEEGVTALGGTPSGSSRYDGGAEKIP